MSREKIILVGGGGHCCSCIDVIEQQGQYEIAGIVEKDGEKGDSLLGYPIIGSDSDIPNLIKKYKNAIVTVGQIKSPLLRKKLFQILIDSKANLPVIISPFAYVSKHAEISEGTIVMHGAIVNANTKVGRNCILNTKSLCEHDVIIGNHCHISTATIINGGCIVEDEVFVGSNTCSRHGFKIAKGSVISHGGRL